MKANVVTMITMLLLLLLKITLVRCRSGTNNCLVTEETRNCISCRYDKCIKAGMKVLLLIVLLMLMLMILNWFGGILKLQCWCLFSKTICRLNS